MNKYKPESAILNKGNSKLKRIVFSENNRVYECVNGTNEEVLTLHVDGGLVSKSSSALRCDYAFEIDGEFGNRTCLVELKGHDIKHACKQLYETLLFFEKQYPVKKYFCRLVTSGNKKPNIESIEEKRLSFYLRKKSYDKLKVATKKISEKMSELK